MYRSSVLGRCGVTWWLWSIILFLVFMSGFIAGGFAVLLHQVKHEEA